SVGVLSLRMGLTPLLRRFGIRKTMLVDSVVVTAIVGAMGFFTSDTPNWVIVLVLFLWGMARSVQYINMQALSYADMGPEHLTDATTMVALSQRFTFSLGVALGTML